MDNMPNIYYPMRFRKRADITFYSNVYIFDKAIEHINKLFSEGRKRVYLSEFFEYINAVQVLQNKNSNIENDYWDYTMYPIDFIKSYGPMPSGEPSIIFDGPLFVAMNSQIKRSK